MNTQESLTASDTWRVSSARQRVGPFTEVQKTRSAPRLRCRSCPFLVLPRSNRRARQGRGDTIQQRTRKRSIRVGDKLLGQPSFAHGIKVVLVVFRALERADAPPHIASISGSQSQDLGYRDTSFIELMARPTGAPPKGAACGLPFASNASARTRRQVPMMLIMRLLPGAPRIGGWLWPSPIGNKQGGRQARGAPPFQCWSPTPTQVPETISYYSKVNQLMLLRSSRRASMAFPIATSKFSPLHG